MFRKSSTESLITKALNAIRDETPAMYNAKAFTSSHITKQFFQLRLEGHEREHFDVLFLDNQHKMISCERMFSGTIDQASVYPREIVKEVLKVNAAAVIFAHNHPSGIPEPSKSDDALTSRLKSALELIAVRVLDHIIVGNNSTYSYQENGAL